jgi:Putative prokaryotic signal transducing protein
MSHVKVYTGSPVLAKAAAARLEEANIPYIEKDVTPGNALTGDLGGGTFEIHVEEADKARAEVVLEGV